MTLELRPYQREAVDSLYPFWAQKAGNPLIVIPTAGGKSLIMATFIKETIERWPDTRILVVTHVKELIEQNYHELLGYWPFAQAGIYSAGLRRRDHWAQILFCGIQSVHKKAHKIGFTDLILVDEAHLIPRNSDTMYQRFFEAMRRINPHMKIVGYTATPYRLDSGRLDDGDGALFDGIAYDANMRDLIDEGYLSPLISKATAAKLDVRGVKKRGGEYITGELQAAVDRLDINKAAVNEIVDYGQAHGRRGWLIFCSGVEHAHHINEIMCGRGVACATIVGDTPSPERAAIIQDFRDQKLQCLTNANVLTTGFNARHVDLIGMLRPTMSTGLYVQMVGRGSRLFDGKENCLILDFAGNIERHGPIDAVAPARPEGGAGDGEGEAPVKACPNCMMYVHAAVKECPECGEPFPEPEPSEKLTATAALAPIMSTEDAPVYRVNDWGFCIHEKIGKPPSMRVEYNCGLRLFSEWVCFEHAGFARRKAREWWIEHDGDWPVPETVERGIQRANQLHELTMPKRIAVMKDGNFDRICNRFFDDPEPEITTLSDKDFYDEEIPF